MKGKGYVIGFVALLVIILASIVMLFDRKVQVIASTTVFKEQEWHVVLSKELHEKSVSSGDVYVTNSAGKKITVPIEMRETMDALMVKGLKVGTYKLHILEDAFQSKSLRNRTQIIDFEVVEKIESVQSTTDLKHYFTAILNEENKQRKASRDFSIMSESADMAESESKATNDSTRHSDTNNQVEGIEEGDVTVTDGRHIYTISDEKVKIIDVQNKASMKVASSIKLKNNEYPSQLMVHGQYLLVAYDSYKENYMDDFYNGKQYTNVAIYDVRDAGKPLLVREIGQEGAKMGLRKQGDLLYVVSSSAPNYHLLEEYPNTDLRPTLYDSIESEQLKSLEIDRITILPNSNEPSYLVISSLNLADLQEGELQTESFLGSSSQMYMSEKAIYVTAVQYDYHREQTGRTMLSDRVWTGAPESTQLFKFAINQQNVSLAGQTTIPGMVLNQFSMDEYDGYLRVAATEGSAREGANSKNSVYVFDQNMNRVGLLTDLARGERIYSARFMGDKAYVVTFKEVDPLFVIDVANPQAPKVLGELKIPGFSNYLHPISDTHLLGIGYDTEVRTDEYSKQPLVLTKGMKVALFDVTDLANPKEQDVAIIGGRGTYSDVQHNHRALFRDVENGLYGFPIAIYNERGEYDSEYVGSGALIYRVTTEQGIELVGDLVQKKQADEQYEDWEKMVQRLLYIDDGLFTVAHHEVKSYTLDGFKLISKVSF